MLLKREVKDPAIVKTEKYYDKKTIGKTPCIKKIFPTIWRQLLTLRGIKLHKIIK